MPAIERRSLRSRLADQRQDKGLHQGEIGEKLGLKRGIISVYERDLDSLKKKGYEFVKSFFEAYQFNDSEVAELLKEIFGELESLFRDNTLIAVPDMIPVYAAGTGPAWGDSEVIEYVQIPASAKTLVGLKAMGDSMQPYLNKGDIAIIDLDAGTVKPGDFVAVWFPDEGVCVKRFVNESGSTLLLESLNPGTESERFHNAPLGSKILGKVIKRLLNG